MNGQEDDGTLNAATVSTLARMASNMPIFVKVCASTI
jgi:transformation/transcription domain-associated protein